MANVLFKRGSTATINGTAIADGQLLYNTTTGQQYIDVGTTRKEVGKTTDNALSTTSTNAIANNALTNSIINTTAEVNAITADNIPCGTKPVKELIKNFENSVGIDTRYNSTDAQPEWSVRGADTWNPFNTFKGCFYAFNNSYENKIERNSYGESGISCSNSLSGTITISPGTYIFYGVNCAVNLQNGEFTIDNTMNYTFYFGISNSSFLFVKIK